MRVSSRAIMSVEVVDVVQVQGAHQRVLVAEAARAGQPSGRGILLRILPRASSASTAGSRSPAISASIMSRADRVVSVEATESILMPPSSRTLASRCSSLVRSSMSFLR